MAQTPLILICDDQPMVHETLGVYLDSEGFSHISDVYKRQVQPLHRGGEPRW